MVLVQHKMKIGMLLLFRLEVRMFFVLWGFSGIEACSLVFCISFYDVMFRFLCAITAVIELVSLLVSSRSLLNHLNHKIFSLAYEMTSPALLLSFYDIFDL